jgi:arabinofuranosyltransferase
VTDRYHAPVDVTVAAGPEGETGSTTGRRLTERIDSVVGGRWTLAEVLLYVVAAIAGWMVRFVQDDAFITYRFARNLARGNGLVFNPGERVEGYTNFLWTAIHAIPEKFGWTTPAFSQILGVVLMVGTVAVSLRLARRLFADRSMAYLATLALVANVTFIGYATGGLETMLQTLLVISVAALLLPVGTANAVPADRFALRRVGAGAVAGLAVLTRMDSAVLVATFLAVHLIQQLRSPAPDTLEGPVTDTTGGASPSRWPHAVISFLQFAVPAAIVVVPWLVWKLDYYGELLPNTFFAKSAANPLVPFLFGILYLLCFFASYAAFLLIGRFRRLRGEFFAIPGMAQVFVVVPVWFLYICVVGADFMEFRFLVPVLPILALLAGYLVNPYRSTGRHVLLVGALLAFSGAHAIAPTVIPYPVLTFKEISHWPSDSKTTWQAMGNLLHDNFPGGPEAEGQPVIAVAPLGIISYYSDLPSVDMLGLTDAWVARHGDTADFYYPGHVRMAPVGYLERRGVNLVIGQPGTLKPDPERTSYRLSQLALIWPLVDLKKLPSTAKVIEIPLTEDLVWAVLYLQPNDKVDAAIAKNGWRVVPIDRVCRDSDLGNAFVRLLVGHRTCG